MKRTLLLSIALVACGIWSRVIPALAADTAFTYQGRLNDAAAPATGNYDLRFAMYDSTNYPGALVSGPLTNSAMAVSNGLFTATLDFGPGVFNGAPRWLEIGVRTNGGGAFTTLAPRQPLSAAPYALYAPNAGSVAAANINGPLALSQLPAAVLTNHAGGVTLNGTFSGVFASTNFHASKVANLVSTGFSGTFTSGGGTLLMFVSGSAYAAHTPGYISVGLDVDDNPGPGIGITANQTLSHMALVPGFFIFPQAPAGAHGVVIYAASDGNSAIDAGDVFSVTVLELPF